MEESSDRERSNSDIYKRVEELEEERTKLEVYNIQLQKKYTELLRELQRVRQPPLMVGYVLELLPDRRVLIKHTNGNQFVVPALSSIYERLEPGMRVALSQQNLTIVDVLPSEVDERVKAFEVIEKPGITFKDVGGLEKQIEELRDVVELPLKNPERFKEVGIEPPKGVLLHGPPGTGKTLLAKAVATESNATFIHVVGSELVQKFIGEGAKLVKELFKLAREKAPSIIFIDEIDAIGGKRIDITTGGDREVQRTLIQLLSELDGFRPLEGVAVMAATNRIDILDPALLRPGRFDRIIHVPLPDTESRRKIFSVHLSKVKHEKDIDTLLLAKISEGFSGADIKNVVTEAGINAIKEGRSIIRETDLIKAINDYKEKRAGHINPSLFHIR